MLIILIDIVTIIIIIIIIAIVHKQKGSGELCSKITAL